MGCTIKDIARDSGVSITTVSKIINNNDSDISQPTRERVRKLIAERNYIPSSYARNLVTKRSGIIGLVIPDISNNHFSALARGVESGAKECGYSVIFCNTDDILENEKHYLRLLMEKSVDGLIIISAIGSSYSEIEKAAGGRKPIVFLDRVFDNSPEKTGQGIIIFDNVKGGYVATRNLLEHGHRNIGCITGPLKNKSAKDRLMGYRQALEEFKVSYDPLMVVEGNYRYNSGGPAADCLLDRGVTAMFVQNDLMAVSAYTAIKERGLAVGKDISIVGYDDTEYCSWLTPNLSSVRQPSSDMGIFAANMLSAFIKGEPHANRQEFLPILKERQSVQQL